MQLSITNQAAPVGEGAVNVRHLSFYKCIYIITFRNLLPKHSFLPLCSPKDFRVHRSFTTNEMACCQTMD